MVRFFDQLNRPKIVVIVVVTILAVNGLLFYRYQTTKPPGYKLYESARVGTVGPSEPNTEASLRATYNGDSEKEALLGTPFSSLPWWLRNPLVLGAAVPVSIGSADTELSSSGSGGSNDDDNGSDSSGSGGGSSGGSGGGSSSGGSGEGSGGNSDSLTTNSSGGGSAPSSSSNTGDGNIPSKNQSSAGTDSSDERTSKNLSGQSPERTNGQSACQAEAVAGGARASAGDCGSQQQQGPPAASSGNTVREGTP